MLLSAREAVDRGERVLVAASCDLAIATLPATARRHPGVRVAWLDAHPDFNTPETSGSGFLGGMPLAAACGVWAHPAHPLLDPPVDPGCVHVVGARDIDEGEQGLLERHGVSMEPPAAGPVWVHLDLDVLRNDVMHAAFPAPGGWSWDDLSAALAALPDVVGIEVTGCAAGHAEHVAEIVVPLLIRIDRA
jgi:arginase/N-omega-hydroxy-L-arginine amidinohydrolase